MEGRELREIRQELGWTQARFAAYLGYSTNYYARMERGEGPLRERTARDARLLITVYRLARLMGLIER
jgi:transcriptional regulator with XRE-family HTH domain